MGGDAAVLQDCHLGCMASFWKAIIGLLGLAVLTIGDVRREESQDTNNSTAFDCRYEQSDGSRNHATFPSYDVFRPLMADPKQPQFFARYQSVRRREPMTTVTGWGDASMSTQ